MTAREFRSIDAVLAEPLCVVRDTQRAIGYVGFDIPEDVLAAPVLAAAHLPWDRRRRTPDADRILEDSFPGWSRSLLQDWLDGRFDFMTHVVFTRGDDASQRLYYYVCELQRRRRLAGPEPLIFDTARICRSTSADWTAAAVRKLVAELDIAAADLREGMRRANRRREMLAALDANRTSKSAVYERIARASLFAPVETLDLPAGTPAATAAGKVLLAGSNPPDDTLHLAVEEAGWRVAGEIYDRDLRRLGPVVDADDKDPESAVARGASAGITGPRSMHDRPALIVQDAATRGVDAVVFWLHEDDEAIAWDVVPARRALEARGCPTLVLARRAWDLTDEPQAEIIGFLGGLDA